MSQNLQGQAPEEYLLDPLPTGVQFLAVFYLYNNTIHLVPFDSKEEAEKAIEDWPKHRGKNFVRDAYVIKRDYAKYENGEVI